MQQIGLHGHTNVRVILTVSAHIQLVVELRRYMYTRNMKVARIDHQL